VIPANRIAATSATILQRFEPLPNLNPNVVANNFLNTEGRPTDSNQENARFDFVESSDSTWMFRYGHAGELRSLPTNIPNMANNIDVQGHQGMFRNTRVIAANKVNEAAFSISRLESGNVAARGGLGERSRPAQYSRCFARFPALLGRAEHQHKWSVRTRRGERHTLHQLGHHYPVQR
jgi:hypothetical protein